MKLLTIRRNSESLFDGRLDFKVTPVFFFKVTGALICNGSFEMHPKYGFRMSRHTNCVSYLRQRNDKVLLATKSLMLTVKK